MQSLSFVSFQLGLLIRVMFFQYLLGAVGFGIFSTVSLKYLNEMTKLVGRGKEEKRMRMLRLAVESLTLPLCAIAYLAYVDMQNWLCVVGIFMINMALFLSINLGESPVFLYNSKRFTELKESLEHLADFNGVPFDYANVQPHIE